MKRRAILDPRGRARGRRRRVGADRVAAHALSPTSAPQHLVFTYEDDLWLVAAAGGQARRLTSGPGFETAGKFSPDGQWIAFTADYDGGTDVYVMPIAGGEPRRLTFHPGPDQVLDWHPDGRRILFRSSREHPLGQPQLYLVDREGGLPEKVAVDRGALGELLARRQAPRLQPHRPRGRHLEALPGRHGPGRVGGRLRHRAPSRRSPTSRAPTTSPCGGRTASSS